jgi:hypothetical protein
MRRALLLGLLLLAGCGQERTLRPPTGRSLPPKPATSPTTPTATQLLTPPAQVRPARNDELLTKSTPRPDDPFDLPPR